MKKLSIVLLITIILFCCLNPFIFFLHRNKYIEENTLKIEIAENLKMCEEDNLQELDVYNKEELIALFSELQNVEFDIVEKQEAVSIILNNSIDENAIRTGVPTRHIENSDKIFESIQIFETNNTNYVLCEYLLKNGNGYSLFAFSPTEKLAELLQKDILNAGKFDFHMKVQAYDALWVTVKYFLPVTVVAFLLFVLYLRKEKVADAQTRKILATISKIGCIVIPIIMAILIIKVYT